jgi:hypothetical protein
LQRNEKRDTKRIALLSHQYDFILAALEESIKQKAVVKFQRKKYFSRKYNRACVP